MKRRFILLTSSAILLVAATCIAFFRPFATTIVEHTGKPSAKDVHLETTRIRPADASIGQLKAAGQVNLIDKVQVVVQIDSFVEEVLVKVGDKVSAGDLLVSLDQNDLKRVVEQARISLTSAELRLQRLLTGTDQTNIELEKLSVQKEELNLQKAVEALASSQLIASIDGTVLSVDVAGGIKVAPGTVAVTLADFTRLEVTVQVAEVDIPKIEIGQKVDVAIDAFPEAKFAGEIIQIEPFKETQADVINYPVTIRLVSDSLPSVLPGMTAVATLNTKEASDRWLVPSTAIQEVEGETIVVVVRGEEENPISVKPEEVQGEWTVVRSAQLQRGDEVLGRVDSFVEG